VSELDVGIMVADRGVVQASCEGLDHDVMESKKAWDKEPHGPSDSISRVVTMSLSQGMTASHVLIPSVVSYYDSIA
jgi:hypothetical protein